MMNITKNKLAEKVGVLMIIALSFGWLSACVASPPQPPISIPFAIHQKGSKIETEFVIKEDAIYSFSLNFVCKDDVKADCARVEKLVGSRELDINKNPKDYGIPTPLTLKVIQLDDPLTGGESTVLDIGEKLFELTWSSSNVFNKKIGHVPMIRGHYRVVIISLTDIPVLEKTIVNFSIIRPNLGK